MIDATPSIRVYANFRAWRRAYQTAAGLQQRTLMRLLQHAAATRFGHDHGFAQLGDYRAFQRAVPLRGYEAFWSAYWQPAFPNLVNVSWPGRIPFFAESSGTSTGATKFIPVTWDMVRSNRRAGVDLLMHHLRQRRSSHVFGGLHMLLGGSTDLIERAPGVKSGDLSGIAAATVPRWAKAATYPPLEIASLKDWTQKMARLAEDAVRADIRIIAGTPSWILLFFDELARRHPERGARLVDFFPKLELLIHGGVNFTPYRSRFAEWLAGGHAETREVYAASEGFLASADRGEGEGMQVNLDNGIFYEFVPLAEIEAAQPTRHWIGDVEPGLDYAPVLTTCAGLWAYIVGDIVRFVDRDPPRLLVTGRISYTLSAFGEHLTGEEIEGAVSVAAQAIGAGVRDFAVGALYPEAPGDIGGHLFIVEFERDLGAEQPARFAAALDRELMRRNLDYQSHRAGGFGMRPPQILVVRQGGFAEWMRRRGKLGSQNKVPRVLTDTALFADLRGFAKAISC